MEQIQNKIPKSVLIVGGSGGIGSALVNHLLEQDDAINIAATVHRGEVPTRAANLTWYNVDVTNDEDVKNLASNFDRLDWLINSVGVLQIDNYRPEKSIAAVQKDYMMHCMEMNALPSLLLARHFNSSLKRSDAPLFAAVSARVGSIEENYLGGWYSYRMSKAALNMALKTLSIEWQRTHPHGCVAALHPGTNRTRLSEPFLAKVKESAILQPAHTASLLYSLLLSLDPQQSGQFWTWEGDKLPW